jgi:hypothetical protein
MSTSATRRYPQRPTRLLGRQVDLKGRLGLARYG